MRPSVKLPDKEHFNLREVASALDVHAATVWRWALKGLRGIKLPTFLVGGRRYVRREDLESFLDALNNGPGEPEKSASHQKAAAIAAAEAELDAAGI